MRVFQLLTLGLIPISVCGCVESGGAGNAGFALGPVTSPMRQCMINGRPIEVKKRMVIGLIRIKLPPNLNFSNVNREVRFEGRAQDPIADDKENEDGLGNSNIPTLPIPLPSPIPSPTPPPPPAGTEPFHIYIGGITPTATSKFLAVKIIKKVGSDYYFFDENDIHGVGLGDAKSEGKLCANLINLKGGKADRQITTFFVDLSYPKPDLDKASFNIGVVPNAHTDTPIFIDPKVRNDG